MPDTGHVAFDKVRFSILYFLDLIRYKKNLKAIEKSSIRYILSDVKLNL